MINNKLSRKTLNATHLNNSWVKKQIKKIRKYFDLNIRRITRIHDISKYVVCY